MMIGIKRLTLLKTQKHEVCTNNFSYLSLISAFTYVPSSKLIYTYLHNYIYVYIDILTQIPTQCVQERQRVSKKQRDRESMFKSVRHTQRERESEVVLFSREIEFVQIRGRVQEERRVECVYSLLLACLLAAIQYRIIGFAFSLGERDCCCF